MNALGGSVVILLENVRQILNRCIIVLMTYKKAVRVSLDQ